MIFESHAHYDDKAFDEDREALLEGLKENGIGYVINIGANIETTKNTIGLAKKYPFILKGPGSNRWIQRAGRIPSSARWRFI